MDRQEEFLAPVSGWVTAQDKIYDAMPLYGCVGSYRLWTDGVKVAISTFRTLPFATTSGSVWGSNKFATVILTLAQLLAAR
jgi:hypothetical protein